MNKPQLCLSLSVSLTLMQANLLAAHSAPDASIWQKMSGVNAPQANGVKAKKSTGPVRPAHSAPSTSAGHAMLFLGSKAKDAASIGAAPAAALTIHPAMANLLPEAAPAPATKEVAPAVVTEAEAPSAAPVAAESNEPAPVLSATSTGSSKQLLAQLAPD
ncbi:MAG: hypothetical protein EKK48_27850, partial [Candidatus Melainabacteria bacterium]